MIKRTSLSLLEFAMNTALNLDELMGEKLQALEGRVLKIVVMPLDLTFYMQFIQARIALLTAFEGTPDTILYSNPLGLIRLSFLPASQARSLFHDGVRMEGDVLLGQQVKQLFESLDIDWEGHLARFTGDLVAYQVGRGARRIKRLTERVQASWRYNVSDYLFEESAVIPSPEAIQDFCEEVDELALDVARLEARIRLKQAS